MVNKIKTLYENVMNRDGIKRIIKEEIEKFLLGNEIIVLNDINFSRDNLELTYRVFDEGMYEKFDIEFDKLDKFIESLFNKYNIKFDDSKTLSDGAGNDNMDGSESGWLVYKLL